MDDLIAFVLARFDEAEAVVRRNLGEAGLGDDGWFPDYRTYSDGDTDAADAYLRQFHPKWMSDDIAAKRQIIDEHGDDDGRCEVCADPPVYEATWHPYPCKTLRLLALPFASHPDYREEWRP